MSRRLPAHVTDSSSLQSDGAGNAARLVTRNFLTLGAGEMLARLIGFGATIFIARQLGADAYGIVGFGFAVSLYLATAADAGLEQHGPSEVASATLPLDRLISSVLLGRFALAIVLGVALAVAAQFAPRADAIVLALYGLTLLPAGANARWAHYGLHNGATVARARVVAELLRVLLVFALVREPADALFVPLAQFAGDSVGALWMIARLRSNGIALSLRFDARIFFAVVQRAGPLLANNLLALAIYNADVIFLRVFRTVVEVGQYLAAYTLINFLGVLGNLATVTLLPNLAKLRESRSERAVLVHTALARVFVAGLPIAVGGALLAPRLIDLVFGEEYSPAGPILALLIWTIPPLLSRGVYSAVLISDQRHDLVLRATAFAAALNVGLNFVMIPWLGMIGAAVTTLLAEGIRMMLTRTWALRSGLEGLPLTRLSRVLISTAIMAAGLLGLNRLPLPLLLASGILVYFITLLLAGGLGWEDGRPALRV